MDEAFTGVAFFWPWVGEEEVDAGGAAEGEEPCEGVGAFEVEDADICQAHAFGFAGDFGDPAGEPFDAEEVAFREMAGHFEEERAVAAADVEFERARGIGEDIRAVETVEVVFREEFDGRSHGAISHPSAAARHRTCRGTF